MTTLSSAQIAELREQRLGGGGGTATGVEEDDSDSAGSTTPPAFRMTGRPENFILRSRSASFVGLSLAGDVQGEGYGEYTGRMSDNLEWLRRAGEGMGSDDEGDRPGVVVLFGVAPVRLDAWGGGAEGDSRDGGKADDGGANPSSSSSLGSQRNHDLFWVNALTYIEDWGVPVIYVEPMPGIASDDDNDGEGSQSQSWKLVRRAEGISNFSRLRIPEGIWPPVTVTVDTGTNTFRFEQQQPKRQWRSDL